MEQISFDLDHASLSDCERIKAALTYQLDPQATECLSVDTNADGTISIKAINSLAAKIKQGKKVSYIEIKDTYVNAFNNREITRPKQGSPRVKIQTIMDVLDLAPQLSMVFMKTLAELGGDPYGCCHRFVDCSDALKCLNPDYLDSLACGYKKNLESGRVFYGKNMNY